MEWNDVLSEMNIFDMLYAWIGATDAKLQSREHEHMDWDFRNLDEIYHRI